MRTYGQVRELAPTAAQAQALRSNVGAARFAQNEMLAYVKENLDAGISVSWSPISLHAAWRARRSEAAPWYGECSKEAFQDGCSRLALGLGNWRDSKSGKRKGPKVEFPKPRKRGKRDSWTFTAGSVGAGGLTVRVPRVGHVELKEPLAVPDGARVTAITVRARAGRWFVTVRLREDDWAAPEKKPIQLSVGVDLGVGGNFAVLHDSDGRTTTIPNPRFFRSDERKLARASRAVNRKKRGSKNRRKAAQHLAVAHYRVERRRCDFLHKFTTSLVKSHDLVAIEDLNVAGMMRRRGYKLGKSVADVSLQETRRQCEYKSEWYGTTLVVVDRWYPSSKLCSHCGSKNSALALGDREWTCTQCGTIHDRDANAARNLLTAGSSPVAARGAGVRRGSDTAQPVAKREETLANVS